MDFFDKLGKQASKAYKATADKTGKIAKEAKIKLKMNELKSEVKDLYEEIGKKVYEKHVREEDINIKKDLEEECTKIDVLSNEIEDLLQQCLELKDKKQCIKCYTEIEKNVKFCPNCGEKQEEISQVNNETAPKEEMAQISEEQEADEEIKNKEEISNEEQELEELEEIEKSEIIEEHEESLRKTVEVESAIDDENNKQEQ